MRVLIAPDKFKDSLGAAEVAENIAAGLREILPEIIIDIAPLADGGEGTAELICDALGGSWRKCKAHDPRGREIEARYALIAPRKLAVIEMSEAAGMRRLGPGEQNVDRASTFGVGEMILDAVRHGADEIVVGLGGSATNDGGFGMARALGFRFLNAKGEELRGAVSDLLRLDRIVRPMNLTLPRLTAAADVRNPLLGDRGATRIFGPQKGATETDIEMLEAAVTKLADVVAQDLNIDCRSEPGSGAAGGLGFGLMSFCGATMRSGFEVVAEAIDLEAKIRAADVVITGEGILDRQTLGGKAPAGVAQLARKFQKRIYAIVGNAEALDWPLFDEVFVLARPPITVEESIGRTAELLRARTAELAHLLQS